jgi:16S rRNA (cytidine1402-2'-O)-methyltransferase
VKDGDAAQAERVLDVLLESLPASEAARLAARITGAPRNALYKAALELTDRHRGKNAPANPRRRG